MLLFHFFLLPQNPDFPIIVTEAFEAISSCQKMAFARYKKKFTFYSLRKLSEITGAQKSSFTKKNLLDSI
jgi:hypothetical protein